MNFEALKMGFISYLEGKIAEQNTENEGGTQKTNIVENSDISIFTHSEEFKNYLVQEMGADASIFSKSISEIMSMDFENGVENEYSNSDKFEKEDTSTSTNNLLNTPINGESVANEGAISEGANVTLSTTEEIIELPNDVVEINDENNLEDITQPISSIPRTESSDNIINRLLEKVYETPEAVEMLDTDGDGVISDEEKSKFEEFITGYDGDSEGELSEADIKRAYDDILNGEFSYDNDLDERSKEIDEKVEEELAEKGVGNTENVDNQTDIENTNTNKPSGNQASYNSFSDSSAVQSAEKSYSSMTLDELESEKTTKQSEVQEAQAGINAVHSGENEVVKAAEDNLQEAKEAYDEAVKNDENISDELKEQREDNLSAISAKESSINNLKTDINNKESEISEQKSTISACKANISALESALGTLNIQTSDDPEVQAEIETKKSQVETQLQTAKKELETEEGTLETLEGEKDELDAELEKQEGELSDLEDKRAEIEAEIEKNCAPETKEAMQKYNEAKENVQTVREAELILAQDALSKVQGELDEINSQINAKKAEATKKENSVSEFDFDFELTLSDVQENELEAFKENWDKNKDKYEAVEEATGMPAELVAAIHWREGSGNFNTYLHNGQQLGQTTTIVPKGIYFEDWTEAAIDAVKNYGTSISSIDPDDIETYYNYAEHYNGMGYANKGLPSPYVWAGTDNYEKGKYVADGKFDPNYVDQQLGVAVMLKTLLE